MAENKKKKYTFRYKLSYQEAYNAFLALALRWSKKVKYGMMGFAVLLTLIMMVMFIMHPDRFYYFLIVILAVALTAYIFYSPALKARRGAKAVAKIDGTYEVSLSTDGKVSLAGGEARDLKADRNTRALELSDSFAVRLDGATILCIPKRIMNDTQQEAVRQILKENIKFSVYDK